MARIWLLAFTLTLLTCNTRQATQSTQDAIFVVSLSGPIGPASAAFVSDALAKAATAHARAVVLEIDTPGGLDTSMRVITQAILQSPVAVIGYVAPAGARAASAGTFILYATHLAAMAPGTNLGAATPVALGGTGGQESDKKTDDASSKKAVNDAVAYIQSLAELRHRNTEFAEEAVREGKSLPATDAQKAGVVELVANDLESLLAQANGRDVNVLGSNQTLQLKGSQTVTLSPSWASRALAVVTSPNVVLILMMLGIYGLFFELASPGAVFPGVLGATFLLLGLYGLHILPVSGAGLILIVLGLMLVVAEAFVPSFGVLGLSGIAAIVLGGLLLFNGDVPGFEVSPWVLGTVALAAVGLFGGLSRFALRVRKRPVTTGKEGMVGARGVVLNWRGNEGDVLVHGERWHARAASSLSPNDRVLVQRISGLTLTVTSTSVLQQEQQP